VSVVVPDAPTLSAGEPHCERSRGHPHIVR
jgi:hypothetical protein